MFQRYATVVKSLDLLSSSLPNDLLLHQDGQLSVYYAPFDYINKEARIVICGITPGFQQARVALEVASNHLKSGFSESEALKGAKATASFAGSMRNNLIRMLDYCGVQQKVGISSCSELFGSKRELLHTTSALRYPVFINGKNYSGSPSMLKNSFLREQIDTYLVPEVSSINSDALFIPLGEKVAELLLDLAKRGVLSEDQVLSGMPHPSGANAERIKFFLGEKEEKDLSEKTNPVSIYKAKELLLKKLEIS